MLSQSFNPELGRAFKYQFDLRLQSIEMEIPFPCYVELSWRRKNKSIQTKQKLEVKGFEKSFKFLEKLSMISTCYYDSSSLFFKGKNVHSFLLSQSSDSSYTLIICQKQEGKSVSISQQFLTLQVSIRLLRF